MAVPSPSTSPLPVPAGTPGSAQISDGLLYVYMHGTPAVELFAKPRRDFSHGCIRLENAEELAVWVLRSNPGWTRDRIRAAMEGSKTVQVSLAKPVPVLIVYATAIALENGEVHFFDDVYGHDAVLHRVLEKGYPYSD